MLILLDLDLLIYSGNKIVESNKYNNSRMKLIRILPEKD